jgi:multidrug efflux pump subunit AcrA (membrane-fusion protein)
MLIGLLGLASVLIWYAGNGSPEYSRAPGAPQAVPVTAARAEARNVPVYLEGLGTVQAFNTVSVKSRVDGQITKVLFEEGQVVKAGDPLFQIDPRPFQAALDQARAVKQKDEAQLHCSICNATRNWRRPGSRPSSSSISRPASSVSCKAPSRQTRRRSIMRNSTSTMP